MSVTDIAFVEIALKLISSLKRLPNINVKNVLYTKRNTDLVAYTAVTNPTGLKEMAHKNRRNEAVTNPISLVAISASLFLWNCQIFITSFRAVWLKTEAINIAELKPRL